MILLLMKLEELILNLEKRIGYKSPHCRYKSPINFSICPKCGKRSNRCHHCGYIFNRNLRVCLGCGKKINNII